MKVDGALPALDEAHEEIRQLRALLAAPKIDFPSDWRLSRAESRLLATLCRHAPNFVAYEVIIAAMESRSAYPRNRLGVSIHALRRKLPASVRIVSQSGFGFGLTTTAVERLRHYFRTE